MLLRLGKLLRKNSPLPSLVLQLGQTITLTVTTEMHTGFI